MCFDVLIIFLYKSERNYKLSSVNQINSYVGMFHEAETYRFDRQKQLYNTLHN